MSDRDEGFLSRWSRRKAQVRTGAEIGPAPAAPAVVATPPVAPLPAAPLESDAAPPAEAPPVPTMDDVAALTRESDYARFVMPGVDDGVKSAAMKKLFSDPHFNVMDGLDTYIDDYNKPDPIPLAMLRQMNQSKFLRLFDDDEAEDDNQSAQANAAAPAAKAAPETAPETAPAAMPAEPLSPDPIADDHVDLRLQQDDAAGRPGPGEGAGA